MDKIHAMFWDAKVFINKKHQYLNNEILVRYLNLNDEKIADYYNDLKYNYQRILLKSYFNDAEIQNYNDKIKETQKILNQLDKIYLTLPPFDICLDMRGNYHGRLTNCLNCHADMFEDGVDRDPYGFEYPDSNKYGYLTCDKNGEVQFWLERFEPSDLLFKNDYPDKEDLLEDIEKANTEIHSVLGGYVRFLESIMRVKSAYATLLDEYIHIRHSFLDEHQAAEQFEAYLKTESSSNSAFKRLGNAAPQAVSHEVFTPDGGKAIICDSYDFENIGDFLYTDFFRGLGNNYLPKKCNNCGKWFLLPFGKYSDYCENPLPDEPSKSCREIGARKKYDDKCKTDPIWLAYNRAYKAHYARYLKKKMTTAEFEKWSSYAVELRTQSEEGTLGLDEYQQLLKV